MNKLLFSIILIFIFSSCNKVPDSDAPQKVAKMFGAKNYSVSYNSLHTTDGNKNSIEFILKDVKVTSGTSDDEKKVTSALALSLYETFSETDRNKYDEFKVGIKNRDEEFNNTYYKNDLASASLLRKVVDAFFSQEKDSVNIRVFDSRFIADTSQTVIRNYVDSILPKTRNRSNAVTNFEIKTIPDTHEPIISYTADSRADDKIVTYIFYVSQKTDKIVYIHVR